MAKVWHLSSLLTFFFKFIYLSKLYTQCGAQSPHPEIKSHTPYPLSQPAPHLCHLHHQVGDKAKQKGEHNGFLILLC